MGQPQPHSSQDACANPRPKWSAPAGMVPRQGCRSAFGKRTCKPNSVVCGHSSRRRVAADAHQRPTRRFRHVPRGAPATKTCRWGPRPSRLNASGRCAAPQVSMRALPSLFGLAPCGVYPDPSPYGLSGALLPHHFTLTPAGLAVQAYLKSPSGGPPEGGVAEAVSFLWHWPSMSLEAHVPDVIRHTALRSSDFPPPEPNLPDSGSDRPVLLPASSVSRNQPHSSRFGCSRTDFSVAFHLARITFASRGSAFRSRCASSRCILR